MENFRKIRQVLRGNRENALKGRKNNYFRVDRRSTAEYFRGHPKIERPIYDYFRKLKEEGKKIVYVDICGRTTAVGMGSDFNYSYTLNPDNWMVNPNNTVRFDGDLFNKSDFLRFINLIKEHGDRPNLVTFEPIAGLQGYNYTNDEENKELHKKVVWQQLENNLKMIVDILEPGGYIYLAKPFQLDGQDTGDFFRRKNQNEYERSKLMKTFCRKNKLRIMIEPSIMGPLFLINKPIPNVKS